jgi:superoxide reductase
MSNKLNLFVCKHCGNVALLVNDPGAPLVCCGDKISKLEANTTDASVEKHMPVAAISGNNLDVKIGSVPHPMANEHHIAFVYVETEHGGQRKNFEAGDAPSLAFCFAEDKPIAVYAYCNLHGLWKTVIK